MKATKLFFSLALILIAFAGCDFEPIDDAGDAGHDKTDGPTTGTEGTGGILTDTVYQALTIDLLGRAEGFCATLKLDAAIESIISTSFPNSMVKESGICISDFPFAEKEIFERHNSGVKDAVHDMSGNIANVYGLKPKSHYYIRVWYLLQNHINEDSYIRVCSNELSMDTPDESWFTDTHINCYSIKDANIVARLSPYLEAEWNGYRISGSFEVELGKSQFTATYAQLDPHYKQKPYEDSASDNIALDEDKTSFSISLANLNPGQQVRIRPCVTVNGEKHYGEWQEFKSYELKTEGFVRMSGYQWAACNAGASMPWELGTTYKDPEKAVGASTDCVVPHTEAWKTLINNDSNKWVYGTLEGVAGWYVMFDGNAIFLPFTTKEEFGQNKGVYWTSTKYLYSNTTHVQVFFMCLDDPIPAVKQRCDIDYFYPVGTHDLNVRLISSEQ